MPDGSDVIGFTLDDGASDFKEYVAVARGGKVVRTFDYVFDYSVDTVGGHLAISHVAPDTSGTRVATSEIIDVASGSTSPMPTMPCTTSTQFVASGTRVLANGYVFDAPFKPHAWICLFDTVGKLLVQIDAGLHNHHAASIDFINIRTSVLAKDPTVVWAIREYESYGNYDITLLDTRAPNARKVARLPTPGQLGSPSNLEIDLAETTIASSEVRYRAKSPEGWWWKWQTAKLVDAP